MVVLVICFAIGGLVSPTPNATMQYLATKCIDNSGGQDEKSWFWSRGDGACERIEHFDDPEAEKRRLTADHIVFSFQMPLPRDGKIRFLKSGYCEFVNMRSQSLTPILSLKNIKILF